MITSAHARVNTRHTHHRYCVCLARLSIIVEFTLFQHLYQCRPLLHLSLQISNICTQLSTGFGQLVSTLDSLVSICRTTGHVHISLTLITLVIKQHSRSVEWSLRGVALFMLWLASSRPVSNFCEPECRNINNQAQSEYKHVLANILRSRYVARMLPLEACSPDRRSNVENAPVDGQSPPASHAHLRYTACNVENASITCWSLISDARTPHAN